MDYPKEKLRVVVCDDGGNDDLRFWCHELRREEGHDGSHPAKPELLYVRRTKIKGVPHHAKAGNLNHAMTYSRAEFAAIFDADMIANPLFLRRVLPHFHHANMAMVQTPQSFYNLPPDDPFASENTIMYELVLRASDAKEIVPCVGTGAVFRRKALVGIEGFSYGSVTEDFNTTMSLHAAGWKTAYYMERLQWGLAPETLRATVRQRERWAMGGVQLQKRYPMCNPNLSPDQKNVYFFPLFAYIIQCFFIFLATVPAIGALGADMVIADARWLPRLLVLWLLISQCMCFTLYSYAGLSRGRVAALRDQQSLFWMGPFIAEALWRATKEALPACNLPSWLTAARPEKPKKVIEFAVTLSAAEVAKNQARSTHMRYATFHYLFMLGTTSCFVYRFVVLDYSSCADIGGAVTLLFFHLTMMQAMSPMLTTLFREDLDVPREQLLRRVVATDEDDHFTSRPWVAPPHELQRATREVGSVLSVDECKLLLQSKGVSTENCINPEEFWRMTALHLDAVNIAGDSGSSAFPTVAPIGVCEYVRLAFARCFPATLSATLHARHLVSLSSLLSAAELRHLLNHKGQNQTPDSRAMNHAQRLARQVSLSRLELLQQSAEKAGDKLLLADALAGRLDLQKTPWRKPMLTDPLVAFVVLNSVVPFTTIMWFLFIVIVMSLDQVDFGMCRMDTATI